MENEYDEAFDEEEVEGSIEEEVEEVDEEIPLEESGEEESEKESEDSPEEDTDYKSLYEQEIQRTKSWEGRLRAADQKIKELESTKSDTPEKPDNPQNDATDDLESFFSDYPELKDPLNAIIEKKTKGELAPVLDTLNKLQEGFDERLQPVQSYMRERAAKEHFDSISAKHPDYLDIVNSGKLDAWIKTQPIYLQKTYEEVISRGSAEEAVALLSDYKKTLTNNKSQAAQETRNRQAIESEAVRGKSGGPPRGQPDPDDFDGAWDDED